MWTFQIEKDTYRLELLFGLGLSQTGHSSESTSYIKHRILRAVSWEGEQDRNLPLLDTCRICHISGILLHMLHMFLNTRIGFFHLTITGAHSWEPLAATKCSCFPRWIQRDPQHQISHALNTQAVRPITDLLNLHQNLPVRSQLENWYTI